MSDSKLIEAIDRYLSGEMTGEERKRFEQMRRDNAVVDSQVTEHKHFVGLLKQYGERIELENRLNAIHDEIDVDTLHEELFIQPAWIVKLWRNHHSKISVAASIAIFAVLGTLFFAGYLKQDKSGYQELVGKINENAAAQNAINGKLVKAIKRVKPAMTNPGSYKGTGFALTANGYIVTNYHVIKDADSVYVQNVAGESFRAKIIYSEPEHDIAFLAINDPAFTSLGSVPYSFKKSKSDLGEDVFTVGYPKDALAFSSGSLTSPEGSNGDTTSYEVSIAARPGNSGGPLLDSRGNLIGILTGKQSRYESMAFARKTSYLLDAIDAIPADSLDKKLNVNTKNTLAGLSRTQQIKKLQNYVFMVKVY